MSTRHDRGDHVDVGARVTGPGAAPGQNAGPGLSAAPGPGAPRRVTAAVSDRRAAPGRRRGTRTVVGLAVILTVVALGLGGGLALAGWSSGGWIPAGPVNAGDLRVTLGGLTWRQVTPGVSAPASGSLATTPPGFLSMPGDVVEIRLPVTTFLRGDNLVGQLTVDYAPPTPAGDITVTFHIEDAAGQQVAPATGEAPGGSSLVVPGLVGDNAGVTDFWTVVLTVQVQGDYQWVTPSTPATVVDWGAGVVTVRLDQVRPSPAGPSGSA